MGSVYLRVLSRKMLIFQRFEAFLSHFQLTLISIFDFQFNLLRPKKNVSSKRVLLVCFLLPISFSFSCLAFDMLYEK